MRKKLFITSLVSACCLTLQAQVLPKPSINFDFDPSHFNESEIVSAEGNASGKITDGSGKVQTDAEIVNDPVRGNVLKLPNIGPKGDLPENYRCLRISDPQEGGDASLIKDGDYAISFWVKAAPTGNLNGFPAIMEFDKLPYSKTYAIRINAFWSIGGNKTSLRITDNGTRTIQTTDPSENHIFGWTHFLLQRSDNENNIYLYINGNLVGKTFYNGKITNQSAANVCVLNESLKYLRFNSSAHGGYTYLSDIQIFNAFLNEEQIQQLQKTDKLQIETAVYPADAGTVTPSFATEKLSNVSINATAKEGHVFSHWINGDTIVSRESTYNFKVTEAQKFTAVFNNSEEIQPALEVTGANYSIKPIRNGSFPFQNRNNMQLQNTSAGIIGQHYTQINANSATMPGPLPELYAKATTDGYIHVLTNDEGESVKDSIIRWAAAYNWEKVDHLSNVTRYHTALPTDQFSVYRKAVKANQWIKIEQPNTFTGVILTAPSLIATESVLNKEEENTLKVTGIVNDKMLEEIHASLTPAVTSIDLTESSIFTGSELAFDHNPQAFVFLPTDAQEELKIKGAIGVKGTTATTPIKLDENYPFSAPKDLTGEASYIRSFTATSGEDSETETNGWQSIVLPYTATEITAVQDGKTISLVPFKEWDGTREADSKRPFWLYKVENGNFTATSTLEANTAYLLAIPNSEGYDAFFNVTGDINFHGTTIATTTLSKGDQTPDYMLVPNFTGTKEKVYALNTEGSKWVNEQSVHSFNAYATVANASAPQSLPIFNGVEITGIREIPAYTANSNLTVFNTDGGVTIRSLTPGSLAIFTDSGQLLSVQPIDEGERFIALKSGKYIINARVIIVK